jgi:hypothetical protein
MTEYASVVGVFRAWNAMERDPTYSTCGAHTFRDAMGWLAFHCVPVIELVF